MILSVTYASYLSIRGQQMKIRATAISIISSEKHFDIRPQDLWSRETTYYFKHSPFIYLSSSLFFVKLKAVRYAHLICLFFKTLKYFILDPVKNTLNLEYMISFLNLINCAGLFK